MTQEATLSFLAAARVGHMGVQSQWDGEEEGRDGGLWVIMQRGQQSAQDLGNTPSRISTEASHGLPLYSVVDHCLCSQDTKPEWTPFTKQ